MKKLMILGGSKYIVPVIKQAHELGIFVITCDYLPNNFAHKYSDKYLNISIIDKRKILKAARNEKIDGIISFACDPGVVVATYVARKLKLPSCGPLKSVKILQDKSKFRKFLKKNNFNVPYAKSYSSYNQLKKHLDKINFPVIVKPIDSAGSKGVSLVNNKNRLEDSVVKALNFSRKRKFLIEQYIEQKGCSSDCDMYSLNGKLLFKSFSSQVFDNKCDNRFTPALFYWPSTLTLDQQNYLSNELQRLIKLLGLTTSIYNVETRVSNDNIPYIMEVSPRGGGNRLSEMINLVYGVDLIKEYICYSVGIESPNNFEIIHDKSIVEVILHSRKSGKFDNLYIDKSLKNNIHELDLCVKQGEKVEGFSAANEMLGTLVLEFESLVEIENFIKHFDELIRVEVK